MKKTRKWVCVLAFLILFAGVQRFLHLFTQAESSAGRIGNGGQGKRRDKGKVVGIFQEAADVLARKVGHLAQGTVLIGLVFPCPKLFDKEVDIGIVGVKGFRVARSESQRQRPQAACKEAV